MKEYHLHKDDYSKLQLDINDAQIYTQRNIEHCFKPHRHSFLQIIWFKKEGSHFVDYVEYEHPANSIFFLTSGQVHYFCPKSLNEGFLFHFNDTFFNKIKEKQTTRLKYRLWEQMTMPFVCLSSDMVEDFDYLTKKLTEEIGEKRFNYKEQLYHYFQIILLNIERVRQRTGENITLDAHFELAIQFKEAIELYKKDFESVSFFSQLLGVSNKTLTSICKKYFQETPANLIHQYKVLEAKRLLSNTRLSIKEIAFQLGFDQPTYFTKYFKKYTKLTPKEFQKQFG